MQWHGISYGLLPVTIMILVVIMCLIGYSLAAANVENSRAQSLDRRLKENNLRLESVVASYAQLSWGNVGRIQSAPIDEESWRRFISVYDLSKNFSGIEAIGVAYGDSPSNNVINYVSPVTERTSKTVGFNMAENPVLKSAMEAASRTGQTTFTGVLPDIFSTKEDKGNEKPGFLMFTPFYDVSLPHTNPEQRQQALRGFVVAMFRGDVFFDRLLEDDLSHTEIKVYLGDIKPGNLLYQEGRTTDEDPRIVTQKVTQYGQTFTIVYRIDSSHILAWSANYFPQLLLIGGLLTGLLFATVAGYMLRNRYYRLTYEKERDIEFAKDELLSLASHQLRTPATGVKQYLGMVLQGFAGNITSKQREYLERAYASNNRQLGVINDILHLAKLETGRIVLAERKFDLAKMVRDVVDEQKEEAERGGITLLVDTPSHGSMVGDSHMLRMVVENLVSNGIKYTSSGGYVSVKMVLRANRWVIMVKDTGVGISKSDFGKLFKQFSRINNARTEVVTGTGVGLYLAYHLTVLHGGSISVTSRKGKGSTFTVRLPKKI